MFTRLLLFWIIFSVLIWFLSGCEVTADNTQSGDIKIDSALCFEKDSGYNKDQIDLYPGSTIVWRKYFVGTTKQVCKGSYINSSDSLISVILDTCFLVNQIAELNFSVDTLYTKKEYTIGVNNFSQKCETKLIP